MIFGKSHDIEHGRSGPLGCRVDLGDIPGTILLFSRLALDSFGPGVIRTFWRGQQYRSARIAVWIAGANIRTVMGNMGKVTIVRLNREWPVIEGHLDLNTDERCRKRRTASSAKRVKMRTSSLSETGLTVGISKNNCRVCR